MTFSFRPALCAGLLAAVLGGPASIGIGVAHDHEHDRVRDAVRQGEIRPLAELLQQLRQKLPGEIVGTEIERRHGRWVYEFRVIDAKGRLYDVYVDAASGEIVRTKEK